MVSGTSNTGVTWSLSPALGGLASTATTAVYVAPSTAPTTQSVTITATSIADPSKTATAVITLLQAVTVSLSPSTVSLTPSGTQQFAATLLGASNTAVTWSINPSVGTISSAGLYTAPSSILTAQTVTLTAEGVADPTKSAAALVSLSPPVASFTYYVDSVNGSDSNPGTQAAPWKTIGKVNSATLAAGQSVGFKRGDTWRETLEPGQSGSAGNPITFGAYGDGSAPLITGADVLNNWTLDSGHIYYASVSTETLEVFRNGARATLVGSKAALVSDGQWWYDGALKVWIYSTADPTLATWEASQRNFAILVSGKSYINVSDLAFMGANEIGVQLITAAHSIFSNIEAKLNSSSGISMETGCSHVTFSGGSSHDNGVAGAGDDNAIEVGGNGAGSDNILITGMDLYNSLFENVCVATTSTGAGSTNVTISYNRIHGGSLHGVSVDYNHTNLVVSYNLIYGNAQHGITSVGTTGTPSTIFVYNNTVYGNGRAGISTIYNTLVQRNNIFSYNDRGLDGYWEVGRTSLATLTSDYNVVYRTAQLADLMNWGAGPITWPVWRSASLQDAHSFSSDPLFNDPGAGDFTLQGGSPAIGAGVYIPGVNTANPPNIGAN